MLPPASRTIKLLIVTVLEGKAGVPSEDLRSLHTSRKASRFAESLCTPYTVLRYPRLEFCATIFFFANKRQRGETDHLPFVYIFVEHDINLFIYLFHRDKLFIQAV